MKIIAIDPGNTESAYVVYDGERVTDSATLDNEVLVNALLSDNTHDELAIEMIASYGMPVGREVFETCVWIGRFIQAWDRDYKIVYRRDVKLALCGSARAKDGNVRQALIDRFGGSKRDAVGVKARKGPLYGISGHKWSALAVAVVSSDQRQLAGATA